jgi:hypothetical protein
MQFSEVTGIIIVPALGASPVIVNGAISSRSGANHDLT